MATRKRQGTLTQGEMVAEATKLDAELTRQKTLLLNAIQRSHFGDAAKIEKRVDRIGLRLRRLDQDYVDRWHVHDHAIHGPLVGLGHFWRHLHDRMLASFKHFEVEGGYIVPSA